MSLNCFWSVAPLCTKCVFYTLISSCLSCLLLYRVMESMIINNHWKLWDQWLLQQFIQQWLFCWDIFSSYPWAMEQLKWRCRRGFRWHQAVEKVNNTIYDQSKIPYSNTMYHLAHVEQWNVSLLQLFLCFFC